MSHPPETPVPSVPPDDAISPELLDGRYRLDVLLGRGGMGVVYRALDVRLDRAVAVKILSGAQGGDATRFASEVQTLARLVHPNLVRLLDAGDLDTRPFLVMDLIEGTNLAERLTGGPLSQEEVAKVGGGIAAALAYVHGAGIVHRDVKPANVLLGPDGVAYLADFGIARLVDTTGMTATGLTLGTPAYLAPEQIHGTGVGPSADVYALGLVLIECLSGHRAFEGTPSEIIAARLQRDPTIPPDLDESWRRVLGSMTARAPDERITASEAVIQLGALGITRDSDATVPVTQLSRGDVTAVFPIASVEATQRLAPNETPSAPAGIAASGVASTRSLVRRRTRLAALLVVLAVVGVVLGLVFSGVFSGPRLLAKGVTDPRTKSSASTSTSSSTTTTTTPTTTTSAPTTTTVAPQSVASSAVVLVTALQNGVADGAVAPPVGAQLAGLLQPLVLSAQPEPAQQQVQQFDQLVQQFDRAVDSGEITGSATIQALTSAIDGVAVALGTTVPTTTLGNTPGNTPGTTPGNTPGLPGGSGNGHGHGRGH